MPFTPQDWHTRFRQQARWTQELRAYAFERADLAGARRVVEVGCGTGAVLAEVPAIPGRALHGLDIARAHLALARAHVPHAHLAQADAHHLPYAAATFDLAFCHFLLLWVDNPAAVVAEMARVVRPGGHVLALAEPDYGGRVDYPEALTRLGALQRHALRRQGAEPDLGRRLGALLAGAGLELVEVGVLGGRWTGPPSAADQELEWKMIQADLEGVISAPALRSLRELDRAAWARGERVLYVPTFYAWGKR